MNGTKASPAAIGVAVVIILNIVGWVWSAATLNASVAELTRTSIRIEASVMRIDVDLHDIDRRVARIEGDTP